jgi:hypothetical protein
MVDLLNRADHRRRIGAKTPRMQISVKPILHESRVTRDDLECTLQPQVLKSVLCLPPYIYLSLKNQPPTT